MVACLGHPAQPPTHTAECSNDRRRAHCLQHHHNHRTSGRVLHALLRRRAEEFTQQDPRGRVGVIRLCAHRRPSRAAALLAAARPGSRTVEFSGSSDDEVPQLPGGLTTVLGPGTEAEVPRQPSGRAAAASRRAIERSQLHKRWRPRHRPRKKQARLFGASGFARRAVARSPAGSIRLELLLLRRARPEISFRAHRPKPRHAHEHLGREEIQSGGSPLQRGRGEACQRGRQRGGCQSPEDGRLARRGSLSLLRGRVRRQSAAEVGMGRRRIPVRCRTHHVARPPRPHRNRSRRQLLRQLRAAAILDPKQDEVQAKRKA